MSNDNLLFYVYAKREDGKTSFGPGIIEQAIEHMIPDDLHWDFSQYKGQIILAAEGDSQYKSEIFKQKFTVYNSLSGERYEIYVVIVGSDNAQSGKRILDEPEQEYDEDEDVFENEIVLFTFVDENIYGI